MYYKIEQFLDALWGRYDQLNLIARNYALYNKLQKIRRHIYKIIGRPEAFVAVTPEPVPFSERHNLEYEAIRRGEPWGGFFDCAWFNFKGKIPDKFKNEKLCLIIDVGGEGCVFDDDGNPDKGLCRSLCFADYFSSVNGKKVYELPAYKEELDVWVDAANNGWQGRGVGNAIFKRADIAVLNKKVFDLYFDFLTLYFVLLTQDQKSTYIERCGENSENADAKNSDNSTQNAAYYNELKSALNSAASALKHFSDDEVSKARGILAPLLAAKSDDDFTVYGGGHAHLDLAWLWPIRETKRKAARTFANQLYLIDRHPDYIFGASQPQQFEWMKELHPGLYKRIKDAVLAGRIEPQGGMWVEADTNATGAESLVRQVLHGKRFFKEEFGADVKTLWLPDAFGFSGALPQIMKKAGMDFFLTTKLYWNKQTKFPYQSFIWRGIDGSEVLAHMPPDKGYNSEANPFSILSSYNTYAPKFTKACFMAYGVGDGGGGPSEGHYEVAARESDLRGLKKFKFASAQSFFEKLEKSRDLLPKYEGELYLETHQGTFTTQAKTKMYNRKIELALKNAELLASLAAQSGYAYPKAQLDKIWKEVLLYQFHDILPGSSIHRVYAECVPRYQAMLDELKRLTADIICHLSQGEKSLSALNLLPYDRSEFIKHEGKWKQICAKPFSSAQIFDADFSSSISCGKDYIENDLIKITFNKNGWISSFVEKSTGREFAKDCLNRLTVYRDKKLHYNAWDIDINYTEKPKSYFKLVSFENIVDGPTVIRRNRYKFGAATTLTQDVVLMENRPYAEFKTDVDWHETHRMLRADFFPSVYSENAVCNIQWGNVVRSTRTDTEVERARFEVAAHKFVYVADGGLGFAVLNDCKYGYRAKDGIISLNLLRSPVYPDKLADRGEHSFTYAIYASSDKNFQNEIVKNGYLLNNPLLIFNDKVDFDSLVTSDKENILTETVKLAEDGSGIILRLYECTGESATAKIQANFKFDEALECDLLEQNARPVDLNALDFNPYEIKTILLKGFEPTQNG